MRPTCCQTAIRFVASCLILLAGGVARLPAEEYVETFDGEEASWELRYVAERIGPLAHRRHAFILHEGRAAEYVKFEVIRERSAIQLEHALPPARRIDDVKLKLWLRCNRPGAILWLRVVFPHHIDPSTDEPLVTYIQGDSYKILDQWVELTCATPEKPLHDRIVQLRAKFNQPNLNTTGVFVDRAIISLEADPGTVEMFLDDMRFGPIVTPQDVQGMSADDEEPARQRQRFQFRLDQLWVDNKPFFLRMMRHHGEPVDRLRETRFNLVWVPDHSNMALLSQLRRADIWGAATPPQPLDGQGGYLSARHAGLVPFAPETAPILTFCLGTRLPANAREQVCNWSEQTRDADRVFESTRPIMADVIGDERVYSRHIDMLGVSRHVTNTSLDYRSYRDWLVQKHNLAKPGTYFWTWVQTEPSAANEQWRAATGRIPPFIEPEQIHLQAYAALSAECRGIGYWTNLPLDDATPTARERRLAIAVTNIELELLEPFVATGKLSKMIPFDVTNPPAQKVGQRNLDFRSTPTERDEARDMLRNERNRLRREARQKDELQGAILHNEHGALLLAIWFEQESHFVPGRLAAAEARIKVEEVGESARAILLTTTSANSLESKPVAGGTEIVIPRFDQTAAVLFTSNLNLIGEIRSKIERIAPESARLSVELAREKLARVKRINHELEALGHGQFDAPQLLAQAEGALKQAEEALVRGDLRGYDAARLLANECMQYLRILQRAHWDEAVEPLASPIASPYTVCFQTLPDHYRLLSSIGSAREQPDANLLRSGDFEDKDTMLAARWQHTQNKIPGILADADLHPNAQQGTYCLRMFAVPAVNEDPPLVIEQHPVTLVCPGMPVRAGQIIQVSGWVKVDRPITGSFDGVMLYDNLHGPVGALRFSQPMENWQRFVFLREVNQSCHFSLTFTLCGMGMVRFDDVTVVAHEPHRDPQPAHVPTDVAEETASPFNLFNRLPGFRNRTPKPLNVPEGNGAPKPVDSAAGNDRSGRATVNPGASQPSAPGDNR